MPTTYTGRNQLVVATQPGGMLRRPVELKLAALVAVMDDAVRPALTDRHLQRVQHQFGRQMVGHRPADNLAAPGIQNHCEIEKTARRRHEGDVGNPELVRPESSEIAVYQVGRRSSFLVPPCGNDGATVDQLGELRFDPTG